MSSAPTPLAVDEVSIQVLVDNTIEWFYDPAPQDIQFMTMSQLSDHPPVDEELGLPIVDLSNYCCESKSISRNADALRTQMGSIERIILSHWHADHSGGILQALELIKAASPSASIAVDLQPDRPIARGITREGRLMARLPADLTFDEIKTAGGDVDLHAEAHTVAGETAYVSGQIPRVTSFETGMPAGTQLVEVDGQQVWKAEPGQMIMDERYMAIDVKGRGVVIFSSCSHAGIVNVVRDAQAKLQKPIFLVMGGFHLGGRDMASRLQPTVDYFKHLDPPIKYVMPMHCSGFGAKVALVQALGKEVVIPTGVGCAFKVMAK